MHSIIKFIHSCKSYIQTAFSILWVLLLCYFFISVFILSIGKNVYVEDYSKTTQRVMNTILPQGWGFFTRNPKETKYHLYSLENEVPKLLNKKNTSVPNLFGLSRKYRRLAYEFGKIYTSIKDEHWTGLGKAHYSELKFDNVDTFYLDQSFFLIKEGRYRIVKYEIVPWAWANQKPEDKSRFYANVRILKKNETSL